jgi:Ca2+-binding RTX toxin-like protein
VKAATVENAVRDNLVIGFIDAYLSESAGTMRSSASKITTSVTIDLSADKISFGSGDGRLISGQTTSITSVDLSDAVSGGPAGAAGGGAAAGGASVSFKGDEVANTYVASYVGDRIEGATGNDTLTGGAGIDRFVFSSTAAINGVDRIQKFKVGAGGDILDFSAFLTKTGTTNVKTMIASAPTVAGNKWASSDVIVVEGYNLTTPAAIAALFDADGAGPGTGLLATPISVSKTVLITADVIGDAYVWYMVKSANVSATVSAASVVTASEVSLVGVLESVNTLALVPMVATNFG